MKSFFLILLLSATALALESYPIEVGLGWESCRPNSQGQKVCEGNSPMHKKIQIPLHPSSDNVGSYGYFQHSGTYLNIGFQAIVKITHFENRTYDDIITLTLLTWPLAGPQSKFQVQSEMFARTPQDLNRANLIGQAIGNQEFYTNIILGVRAAR